MSFLLRQRHARPRRPTRWRSTRSRAGWAYSGLRILALPAGGSHTFDSGDDELIVLPLEGGCTVVCDDVELALEGRDGVFAGVTDFAYVPRDAHVAIELGAAAAASRCPSARAEHRLEPRHVAAADVPVELRGAGAASRQVINFCAPDAFAADRLIAVEVLTPGGNWSSYPPHKHDEEIPGEEVPLEEIYYFEVAGERARLPARLRLRPGPGDRRAGRGAQRRRAASCRTATTARRWPPRATTSTTST